MGDETIFLHQTIDHIKGIGRSFQTRLSNLGIYTIHDLLHHFPSRYLDYRHLTTIRKLQDNTNVNLLVTIDAPKKIISRTGKLIIQANASDQTGNVNLIWFNNPYIHHLIKPGATYILAGKTSLFGSKISIISPTIELANSGNLHTSGLVPVYPLTDGVSSRFIRNKIHYLLEKINLVDPLPMEIKKQLGLIDYHESLKKIHFPKETIDHKTADARLVFNYHLAINLNNQIELKKLPPSPSFKIDSQLHRKLVKSLPFKLTSSQKTAILAGYRDLTRDIFTHRLIQGETGSGKTVLIFFYANQVLANQHSFCLLAPTEVLANQHYQTFLKLGLDQKQLSLVTSQKPISHLPKSPIIFIGTHALLTQLPSKLTFPLGAVAIDEQHKFGVVQRQTLNHRDPSPHLFNLTATPIPRTLALGLFGEITVTTLKNKPANQLPTKTWVVSPNRYENSKNWIKEQIDSGSKIFVVTPLIYASEKMKLVHNVEKTYQRYQADYGQYVKVFLIHGQMSSPEIDLTLTEFKKSKGGILVSTSIIEVGVDIPETDIIIIHSAERFGLSSLHQLRGRVGRGTKQGYCLLVPTTDEQAGQERLCLLQKHHSGLLLAKKDLQLRGAGELFGIRQHGHLPVRLKNFWDKDLFCQAKVIARQMVSSNLQSATIIASKLISC